jgi:hypothetical protein
MNALEQYLDCQPVNDNNIDNGKIDGNIMLNQNYSISNCANPNYNKYDSNNLSSDDYTHKELDTSTSVNGFAVIYSILIGLIITTIIISLSLKNTNYVGHKKVIISVVIFIVCVSIIYGITLYFITSKNKREIVNQDLNITFEPKNKIKS